jgi:hypothetical protein
VESKLLRRYTELPFVLHMLRTRQLALLSPRSWDDENDAHFMEEYRQRKALSGVFALCFAQAAETYHHWRVFSPGSSGVCVKFDKAKFSAWAKSNSGMHSRAVTYKTLERLQDVPLTTANLPFVKRYAFRDEKEYRLVLDAKSVSGRLVNVDFPLDLIEGIVVNPWLPREVFRSVKQAILEIPGCEEMTIRHSTVVQNEEWQSAIATEALPLRKLDLQ